MEIVVNGVSTRKVAKVTEELWGTEFSKSTVSELCKRLEPLVKAVETQFQGVMWQRCQTHFTCNVPDACPKQLQGELHSQLRVIWEASLTWIQQDRMRAYAEWKQGQTAMATGGVTESAVAGS